MVIVAFVNGTERLLFPTIEGIAAMGTPVFSFGFTETLGQLKQGATEFTTQLLTAHPIVEVEKFPGGFAFSTDYVFRDSILRVPMLDGLRRMPERTFKFLEELFPIENGLGRLGSRFFGKGWKRVYIEVPVIGVFFLKSSRGFTSGLRSAKTFWSS